MEDKEAVKILQNLLGKYAFDEKESEAIRLAIGTLGWTKLTEGWMKRVKKARARREKDE